MNILSEYLPRELYEKMMLADIDIDNIEEIHIHKNGSTKISTNGKSIIINNVIYKISIQDYFERLIQHSYHSYEEDIAQGFVTLGRGIRVGICGKAVIQDRKVKLLNSISSINLRVAKEVIGCSVSIGDKIYNSYGYPNNCLIISPPGCGKTTLIRDICRIHSINGYNIGICDERSEIAAMHDGVSSFDLGPNTDVLDGCPKALGMKMILRSMNPAVIATDEIGSKEDIVAIKECILSGVSILTTVHGESVDDVCKRTFLGELINNKSFKTIIVLSKVPKVGTIKEIHVY